MVVAPATGVPVPVTAAMGSPSVIGPVLFGGSFTGPKSATDGCGGLSRIRTVGSVSCVFFTAGLMSSSSVLVFLRRFWGRSSILKSGVGDVRVVFLGGLLTNLKTVGVILKERICHVI